MQKNGKNNLYSLYESREMSKPPIKFFVSGQVDSGKSTLIGQILHKTANLKFDPQSSANTKFSDLLDVDTSERERGITQFSSNNPFTYQGITFEAIDTPGHLLYIRELINSISENKGSIGCLIVSAVVSEFMSMFENGTTKEDAILMRCCGVNHIIVIINKIDKLHP
jgi:small GTP-binding protein